MADELKSAPHRASLEACWKVDLKWNLYPKKLVDVSIYDLKYYHCGAGMAGPRTLQTDLKGLGSSLASDSSLSQV